MRCISLWQPWASLCCIAHPEDQYRSVKGYETRSWPTQYRGPLLIHAAKRFTPVERDVCFEDPIREVLNRHYTQLKDIPRGAVIGRVTITGCYCTDDVRGSLDDYSRAMGYYAGGRYAWEMTYPVLFEEPIAYRGQQGFFDVPNRLLPVSANSNP